MAKNSQVVVQNGQCGQNSVVCRDCWLNKHFYPCLLICFETFFLYYVSLDPSSQAMVWPILGISTELNENHLHVLVVSSFLKSGSVIALPTLHYMGGIQARSQSFFFERGLKNFGLITPTFL